MALRTIIEDGAGSVGGVAVNTLRAGEVTQEQLVSVVADLLGVVQTITRRLNGLVSMGTGITDHRAGNLDAQYIDVLSPAFADSEFAVPHGLRRIVIGIDVAQQDKAGSVYSSSVGSWDDSIIYLKCSGASVSLKLRVY